jgi:hypothetical protein
MSEDDITPQKHHSSEINSNQTESPFAPERPYQDLHTNALSNE